MPDVAEDAAALCEKFVAESKAIDLAFFDGKLQDWVTEKLADERRAAEPDDA